MIEISERDFDKEMLECELPVFACFTTTWCHLCYPTCLLADQIVREYDRSVKFVRLGTEKNPEITERHPVFIIPTTLIFKNAYKVNRYLDFQDISTLKPLLDNI